MENNINELNAKEMQEAAGGANQGYFVYVVEKGDTLTKIAREYGTTPEELAKANGKPLRKMNLLWVGQKIKLRK